MTFHAPPCMVQQVRALIFISNYLLFYFYLLYYFYLLQHNWQCHPNGCLGVWHASLRPDQTFQHNVIFQQNTEGHHQVDHRYVGGIRSSQKLEVSFRRKDHGMRHNIRLLKPPHHDTIMINSPYDMESSIVSVNQATHWTLCWGVIIVNLAAMNKNN